MNKKKEEEEKEIQVIHEKRKFKNAENFY